MKEHKKLALLSLLLFFLYNCSLPADDEREGGAKEDFTYELPWTGETEKFTINAEEGIRLNDPSQDAGTAYITIPSSNVLHTRWEFGVRLAFNPSTSNYARFYLTSSSHTLSGPLDGYFIQIGGAKDNIALYRQTENQPQLLASGRELMKGNNTPKLWIKVECDANGYWTFWTRLESESEYTKEKQIKNRLTDSSVCCGIYCAYTKSRCNGFNFHHIQISNDVTTTSPDETPDAPINPETPKEPTLPDYPAEVKNLLLFNEVMYDQATDGAEYIELYNPSATTVSVSSLKLLRYEDVSGTMHTTQTTVLQHTGGNQKIVIPAYGYVCFTKSADALIRKHKVDGATIIEVATFSSINNEGGYLAIVTNEEKQRLIDKCSYFDMMHTDKKRKTGISLEKRSPELLSSILTNWRSSTHATGGTPGIKN